MISVANTSGALCAGALPRASLVCALLILLQALQGGYCYHPSFAHRDAETP